MQLKKVKCPFCGSYNWSGSVFCEKCSAPLYSKKQVAESTFLKTVNIFK